MMKSYSPEREVNNTPPIALQLAPASNPGSDSPKGTTGLEPRVRRDSQRPAFLMPTAEADSPRAVTGRTLNTRQHRPKGSALGDRAAQGEP